jgi:HlyD family secretion protein
MYRKISLIIFSISILYSCKNEIVSTKVLQKDVTESIYASGNIESENEYVIYPLVTGIIEEIFKNEGEHITKGENILKISNNIAEINKENAKINAEFSSKRNNQDKVSELKSKIKIAQLKVKNDSLSYYRTKKLHEKNITSASELEQIELLYQNSISNLKELYFQIKELNKQIDFQEKQTKNQFEISIKNNSDHYVKSQINGLIYTLNKKKGDLVSPQTPIAIVGDDKKYIIKLLVDEKDIINIKHNQKVIIRFDSYKNKVFTAKITKIHPTMNLRNKSFEIEAKFITPPSSLYPNLTLEANIITKEKKNCLVIPTDYLVDNKFVYLENGEKKQVEIGLRNYDFIEIINGLRLNDKIILKGEN